MNKLLLKVSLLLTSILLLNCDKNSIEKQVKSLCSSTNFGVMVNGGDILCAKGSELSKFKADGELEIFYTFNNCCAGIYFETINFKKSGTSDLSILRFGTPDQKIDFWSNNVSKVSNGKITVNKIKENKLSASFTASFTDKKGNNVNIEGNFKDIVVEGL